ncbi:MAG: DUF2784 domain-containing protein [Janthinobacterium lividum]
MSLKLLDFLLTVVHLVIIGFNLFGWISPKTRKLHFVFVLITASCWLGLGYWYGIGYCPVTDWQWQVKTQLGEQNLPNSFIKYEVDKIIGKDSNAVFIDIITAASFFLAAVISVYVNFFRPKPQV